MNQPHRGVPIHILASRSDLAKGAVIGSAALGIPPQTCPCFSAKSKDKGPGLSLATVSNLVRRLKRFASLDAEVGKATYFTCYFLIVPAD